LVQLTAHEAVDRTKECGSGVTDVSLGWLVSAGGVDRVVK
jgi:hypothetical protein